MERDIWNKWLSWEICLGSKKLEAEYPNAVIVNPAKISSVFSKTEKISHDEYMGISYKLLKECDAIYMLKDLRQSAGACMEYGFSVAMDLIVLKE